MPQGPHCHCETNPELLNARATTVENTVDGLANRIQANASNGHVLPADSPRAWETALNDDTELK
jgi:hypothetical protein